MLTMTRLDTGLDMLLKEFGPFSRDNLLIIARDMVSWCAFHVHLPIAILKSSVFFAFFGSDQNIQIHTQQRSSSC